MSMGHDVIHRFSIPFREAINALLGEEQIDADAYEVRVLGGCVVIDLINPVIVYQGNGAETPPPFNIPVGNGEAPPEMPAPPEEPEPKEPEPEAPADPEPEPEPKPEPDPEPPAEEPEDDGRSPPDAGQEEMFYQSSAPADDDPPFDGGRKVAERGKKSDQGERGSDAPDRRRSQRAGILCAEKRFQVFMDEENDDPKVAAEATARAVRVTCGVKSRSEFDTSEAAGKEWDKLVAEYDHWCRS